MKRLACGRSLDGRAAWALLICWLVAAPALLAAGVDFEARLWVPDLGGGALVDVAGQTEAIDLASDLGLDGDEALEGRLIWRPSRRTSLRLEYASFAFGGDAVLQRSLTFAGTTFDVAAQVSSSLELDYGGLGFAWQLLSTGDGGVRLGPLIEARGLRGRAAIQADVQGLIQAGASDDFELGFAAAGLLLDVEPTRRLNAYARWTRSVDSGDGTLTDAEAGLRFHPIETLALTLGYRRLDVDFVDGGETFDLELDGPFFGGVLTF